MIDLGRLFAPRGGHWVGVLFLLLLVPATSLEAQEKSPSTGEVVYRARCVACHSGGGPVRAPRRVNLERMTSEAILAALEEGVMRQQASGLTAAERRAVAEYLSKTPIAATAPTLSRCALPGANTVDLAGTAAWRGWGGDAGNARFRTAKEAGLADLDIPRLELRWAFAFPGATAVRSQPAVADGRLFVGGPDGTVYALDAQSGCIHWTFVAEAPVRTAIVLAQAGPGRPAVVFGDQNARIYAVDAQTGESYWRARPAEHAYATATGTPAFHRDRLYVPVSSLEVIAAQNPDYECCTFRGMVVALDAASGEEVWRYYTIDEEASPRGENPAGARRWGPSGAPVWSTPTIDAERGLLYIGAGENYTQPWTKTSDAIHALDLGTGERVWSFQATAGDAWNMACIAAPYLQGLPEDHSANCPERPGPDFDFGMSPMLVAADGRDVLVAGQKSGMVYGFDADRGGAVLWKRRVGRGGTLGGVHWGMASDGGLVFAPVSDRADGVEYERTPRPGIVALNARTGEEVWAAPAPVHVCGDRAGCFRGYSAAVTVIPGALFAGALDGHLRAFSTKDGSPLWDFDTAREFVTVNGAPGRGGSIDVAGPVVAGGMVYVISGYGTFGQMPGNVLLAFSIEPDGQ